MTEDRSRRVVSSLHCLAERLELAPGHVPGHIVEATPVPASACAPGSTGAGTDGAGTDGAYMPGAIAVATGAENVC